MASDMPPEAFAAAHAWLDLIAATEGAEGDENPVWWSFYQAAQERLHETGAVRLETDIDETDGDITVTNELDLTDLIGSAVYLMTNLVYGVSVSREISNADVIEAARLALDENHS